MEFWNGHRSEEPQPPQRAVDPAQVLPDHLLAKVLGQLDTGSLKRAASVSRTWSEKATQHVKARTAEAPTAAQLQSRHGANLLWFTLQLWLLSVHRWPHVVEYVRVYKEAGFERALIAYVDHDAPHRCACITVAAC